MTHTYTKKSFTVDVKFKAVCFSEKYGKRAVGRELGLNESPVQYWPKQKKKLKRI